MRYPVLVGTLLIAVFALLPPPAAHAWDAADAEAWVDQFAFAPPPVGEMPLEPAPPQLPTLMLDDPAGPGLVRVSLPFTPGALPAGKGLRVNLGESTVSADVRVLTVHPDPQHSVRRALVTFPYEPVVVDQAAPPSWDAAQRLAQGMHPSVATLELTDTAPVPPPARQPGVFSGELGAYHLEVTDTSVRLSVQGAEAWTATVIAPERTSTLPPTSEVVETGQYLLWVRVLAPDPQWPRIIDVQLDSRGRVELSAQLQRLADGDGTAPDLGWKVAARPIEEETGLSPVAAGDPPSVFALGAYGVNLPDLPHLKRGETLPDPAANSLAWYRCHAAEQVPMQSTAWRTARMVIDEKDRPAAAITTRLAPETYDVLYHCGVSPILDQPFEEARTFHQWAMAQSTAQGDDYGNVSGMPVSGVFGMNRLNHCPAILEEYYRSGYNPLRETALRWCENFYDLTIWWGNKPDGQFGGTRYNNMIAQNDKTHIDDKNFMWRSNDAVHFCTKGYDSFFYAYEETGDPRMAVALRWQTDYAARMIHTDQGECRNIGDVMDFMRLYRFTGHRPYYDNAMRLFRELRTKLGENNLFSQGGHPIEAEVPFIEDDAMGTKHPFAKPYIIGYALQGLPELVKYAPDEPRLADTIRAVAKFLAGAQDPVGGWRYPHPRSSSVIISQGMEHAVQLARAAAFLETQGDDINPLLDAIERVLRVRLLGFQKTGGFLGGLQGWESSTGSIPEGKTLYDLYTKPEDRDRTRDYTEGVVGVGISPPEGVVYFSEVLDFYAKHRDLKGLQEAGQELALVLGRTPAGSPPACIAAYRKPPSSNYPAYGMEQGLPVFADKAMPDFEAAKARKGAVSRDAWTRESRRRILESLGRPPAPPRAFEPVILAEEDRGGYVAKKIVISLSEWYRAPAYLLVPKGAGPFPAVLALHDHGAHFSIGKEKVVRPFGVDESVAKDAREWVDTCYGGRFFGDLLAERGYVVLAVDALFWGERGRKEGIDYKAQEQLAANLLQLGMSWLGVITWDDLRSADFLATLPEVDPARIGAMGLSVGCHRTWMLSGLSDRIAAGAAICWMGTTQNLMQPGNNQTKGQSAFCMIAPGLRAFLDYAGVAALACPKPMLFYNGDQDTLFPVAGVEAAWSELRQAYEANNAAGRLETRMWPNGHEFNQGMQDAAFTWLDQWLKPRP